MFERTAGTQALITVGLGDGVGRRDTAKRGNCVLDDDAVLYVDATNLGEVSGCEAIVGEELSDDGKFLLGVNDQTGSVERVVADGIG